MGSSEKFMNVGTEKLGNHREKIGMLHACDRRLQGVLLCFFGYTF